MNWYCSRGTTASAFAAARNAIRTGRRSRSTAGPGSALGRDDAQPRGGECSAPRAVAEADLHRLLGADVEVRDHDRRAPTRFEYARELAQAGVHVGEVLEGPERQHGVERVRAERQPATVGLHARDTGDVGGAEEQRPTREVGADRDTSAVGGREVRGPADAGPEVEERRVAQRPQEVERPAQACLARLLDVLAEVVLGLVEGPLTGRDHRRRA